MKKGEKKLLDWCLVDLELGQGPDEEEECVHSGKPAVGSQILENEIHADIRHLALVSRWKITAYDIGRGGGEVSEKGNKQERKFWNKKKAKIKKIWN